MEYEFSNAELAGLLRVTKQAVNAMVNNGMPKLRRNVYDARDCVQWLMERKSGEKLEGSLSEARQRLYEAQTEKSHLDSLILKKTLIPASEAHHLVANTVQEVVAALESLGPRIASDVAALEDVAVIEDLIDREIRSIRSDVAERILPTGDIRTTRKKRARATSKRGNGSMGGPEQSTPA